MNGMIVITIGKSFSTLTTFEVDLVLSKTTKRIWHRVSHEKSTSNQTNTNLTYLHNPKNNTPNHQTKQRTRLHGPDRRAHH
jgi:hypothetical protein